MIRLSSRRGIASLVSLVLLCSAAQSLAQPAPTFNEPFDPAGVPPQFAQPPSSGKPSHTLYTSPTGPPASNPVVPAGRMQALPHSGTPEQFPAGSGKTQFSSSPPEFSYGSANDFQVPETQMRPVSFGDRAAGCNCDTSGRDGVQCLACSDRAGLLHDIGGIHFGGWLEQGFTGNYYTPRDRMNSPVLFNDRSNDYQLNQLYLYAEKALRRDGCSWEIGGRVDVLWGSDARFLNVPGLEDNRDRTPKWNGDTDEYGLAIPQAYVELAAPWLNGVSVKAGHFYSIAGYETAPAPQNFFYSHASRGVQPGRADAAGWQLCRSDRGP